MATVGIQVSLLVNSPAGWGSTDGRESCHTPFRLPAINKQHEPEENSHKVWSRYGYEYYNARPADIRTSVKQIPDQHAAQELTKETQRVNVNYPKFNRAMIAPTEPRESRLYAGDYLDSAFSSRSLRMRSGQHHYPEFDPSPTPIGRNYSPPKSRRSVQLSYGSPHPTLYFDKKGRRKVQGVCSREFTVTCSAPSNWLRMKWGRSKTTLQ